MVRAVASSVGKAVQVVDWAVLGSICGDDEALLLRLLDAFLDDGQKDETDLARAIAAGNLSEISRVAHRIYGAARTVGARELAVVSQALDAAALAGNASRVAELAPRVSEHFAAVTAAIRARQVSA
jgi:HPt (histidine-containing phosphotransfer) domain-containing protein